ncbi:hypothetical protein ABEV74_19315 [Paenibacillus cisolokensis]|uniref:hypothetical protein n=1 Tax=Paenibacillus cisolokensis TaxID=1658519 RepID=UPI003D2CB4F7
MKKTSSISLYTAGEQVVLRSGWNADSNSLVGKPGKVVAWKPATVFENPNRNKVVFEDGSYVICDPRLLRPRIRDIALAEVRTAVSLGLRAYRALRARVLAERGWQLMAAVEQMDMFAYLQEIEEQAAAARLSLAPAPALSKPVRKRVSVLKSAKAALSWFWIVLHNLFGIACWVNVYTVTRGFGGREEGGVVLFAVRMPEIASGWLLGGECAPYEVAA